MQKQLLYLSKTQFVSCLSNHQVSLLFEKIKDNVKNYYKTYEAGEHLFRENDESSTGLFLIKEGDVKVSFDINSSPKPLIISNQVYTTDSDGNHDMCTHYRATESLGAFDIIDKSRRCVSALAITKTRVTVLSYQMFSEFCSEHPVVLCHYITDVIARFWRLASFTLHTFLELKEHHPKPADVIQVADSVKESLHAAALTRKVFKCGSVVNMGLDEHAEAVHTVLIQSTQASFTQ
jgi:CRP-like cAMP-binding protein